VTKSKTKAGTNRYVPLHKDIIPLLKEKIKLAKYKPTTYIARNYASEEKYNYSKFSTAFKNCFKNLSFKHSIHECRHTFITLLDSNNVPLIVIKKIVGHVPDDLTGKVYTHVSFIDIIKAIDKLKGKKIIYEHIKQSKFI
jgi:integrase